MRDTRAEARTSTAPSRGARGQTATRMGYCIGRDADALGMMRSGMGILSTINVLIFFYAIPLGLVMMARRRALGAVLVITLSWIGFAIHRVLLARASMLN